jgi:acetyl esterase
VGRSARQPLLEPDLSGLPEALVVVAELDPLRDEGTRYAERLASAGTEVLFRCEPGLIHSFFRLDQVSPACAAAADRISGDLSRLLSSGRTTYSHDG